MTGLLQNLHLDRPVVDQHDVSHRDIVHEILVVDVDRAFLLAAFATHGQGKFLAGLKVQRHGNVAGTDGRALGIHHDPHVCVAGPGGATHLCHDATHPVVRGMGHIQAKHVHPGLDQLLNHFR